MKKKEKSGGSLRERWVERLAGPASAEEMRMWPLMLRTLALNLRAGIPLQEAVHANPGSGQLGESEPVSGAQKMPAKKTTAKKSLRVRRTRGSSPLSDDYGQKRCAEDIRRFTQALATVTSWGAPAHLACTQLLENGTRMRPHSHERLYDLQLSLRMSESAGAPLATSLERAAEHAEERIDALLGRQSALAAPRATGRILSWLPLLGLGLGVLMGSDPVGVLTGSILGALTGLLGLGLAFAGRRWTAALVHRAEVKARQVAGATKPRTCRPLIPPSCWNYSPRNYAPGLRRSPPWAPSPRRSIADRYTRSASAYRWAAAGGVPGRDPRREHSVSCGMRSPPPIRVAHPALRYCFPLPMRTASVNAARQNAPPESSPSRSWCPSVCVRCPPLFVWVLCPSSFRYYPR